MSCRSTTPSSVPVIGRLPETVRTLRSVNTEDELTSPVMDGATDASDHAKKRGLIEQAHQDHPTSASALVHDLQHRARETHVTGPNQADHPTPTTE